MKVCYMISAILTLTFGWHVYAEEKSWDVCTLPSDLGTWTGNYSVKWFYNSTLGRCDRFWYGGEGGNENRFADEEECKSVCDTHSKGTDNIVITEDDATTTRAPAPEPVGRCQQEAKQGPCRNFTLAWYYNSQEEKCHQFWYGNCDGNDNRFDNQEECEAACKKPAATGDLCQLDAEVGRCRARMPMYYYDRAAQKCQLFYYGGCGGNDNRFRTIAECERRCGTKTSANKEKALGDDDALLCRRSTYGCCPDGVTSAQGENNLGCPSACVNSRFGCCDDDMTAAQGPDQEGCDDIEIGSGDQPSCELTRYGCCPDKITAVEDGCPIVTEPVTEAPTSNKDLLIDGSIPAQCLQDSDFGTCRDNAEVMWYYDRGMSACRRFWYGGCDGNENRFKSEKECLTICRVGEATEPQVDTCRQPKETGPCNEILPRWYHNPYTRQCEQFTYSGCSGNNNNFETREACERACDVRGTPVTKPYECPASQPSDGACSSNCRYDADCPGNDKCCEDSNGCKMCRTPYVPRPVTREQVCNLPAETGPCRAYIKRWFLNSATRQCEQFTFGGCGGNQNNFETEETCQTYCRMEGVVDANRRPRDPVCQLEPTMGPCRRSETKWFYNSTTLQCSTFTYGGCLGNHNNFETEAKCLTYCGLRTGLTREEACKQEKQTGSCRGNVPRWYYDAQVGDCFEFVYGGCQGNQNNFATREECMSQCRDVRVNYYPRPPTSRPIVTAAPAPAPSNEDICSLPLQGPCTGEAGQYWYYNQNEGICQEVPNGECNNNRNNFLSREQCERYCDRERVCQPLTYTSSIRCTALLPRWSYDQQSGKCTEFSYGGCGGSSNNFGSQEACERKCLGGTRLPVTTAAPKPASRDEVCAMPEDSGSCLAYVPSWRYDMLDGTCKEFVYGGCGGNENRFNSKEACERYCNRDTVCREFIEPEIGCLAYFRRWRYNPSAARCENFVYGGCGGNANNFESNEACERKCIPTTTVAVDRNENSNRYSTWRDICNMQADVGPCKSYLRKWHYNSLTQDCEEFTYGGCLGNHNNFESRMQCMAYCGPRDEERGVTPAPTDEVEGSGDIDGNICQQPMVVGLCRAAIPSWYYDHLGGECRQFLYGGCGGNDNRFESKEDCESSCGAYNPTKPSREVKAGFCPAKIDRVGLLGACAPTCQYDSDCGGVQKCCHVGCGPACTEPVADEPYKMTPPTGLRATPFGQSVMLTWQDPDLGESQKIRDDRYYTLRYFSYSIGRYHYQNVTDLSTTLSYLQPETEFEFSVRVNKQPYLSEWSQSVAARVPAEKTRKSGYCPAKVDKLGLLGACRGNCINDSDCSGVQKCCDITCGPLCTDPVDEDPYQMQAPLRVYAVPGDQSIDLQWLDPALGQDQIVRDRRYYTVKFHSYDAPGRGYQYVNSSSVRTQLTGLQPGAEYFVNVRVNNPPYLSVWTEDVTVRVPAVDRPTTRTVIGAEACSLPRDPGTCSTWEIKWFYDTSISRCNRFWYGTCGGNANRFDTEEDCQALCVYGRQGRTTTESPRYDCARSTYGCCRDGFTYARDQLKSNCPENDRGDAREVLVQPGGDAVLYCRATSGDTPAWYKDGKLVETTENIEVLSNGTLLIRAATIEDEGSYACRTDPRYDAQAINRFKVVVQIPIGIMPGPKNIVSKPGHTAFLHCQTYGNPPATVSWMKGNVPITSNGHYEVFGNGTLLIRRAEESDIDNYKCMAENGVSNPEYRSMDFSLREMLVARIENSNGRVTEGSRIYLHCQGKGYPRPTITWEKSGRPLASGGNVNIQADGRLYIRDATLGDTGAYTCIVANSEEKIQTSTTVQVVPRDVDTGTCEDVSSMMKCRLIVTAKLCGYSMYSKICCRSCRQG